MDYNSTTVKLNVTTQLVKPVIKDHKIKARHAQAINVFVHWGASYRTFYFGNGKGQWRLRMRHQIQLLPYLTEAIHNFS